MEHDNPADRLLAIILEGKKHGVGERCRDVWQKILNTNDESTLLLRLGLTSNLPRQIVNALQEASPKRGPTWNHWYPQIVNAFIVQRLNETWQTFIGTIDKHSIDSLSTAAELLEHRSPKSVVEPAELDDLKERLTDILKEVRDSTDIDVDLKKKICKAILEIINAIDQYFITGIDGVSEALERAAGTVNRNADTRQFVKKDGLGKKLMGVLKLVNEKVDSAENIKEIGENVIGALEWFDPTL